MTPEDLWSRMVRFYDHAPVSSQCLALQDRLGLSVTTLLTLVLLAAAGRGAPRTDAAGQVACTSEAWQSEVLRPLRTARNGVRCRAKAGVGNRTDALRRALLEQELAAERLEQEAVLEHLMAAGAMEVSGDVLADACRGVSRYLLALDSTPDSIALQSLSHVITAALADYDGLQVSRTLERALGAG